MSALRTLRRSPGPAAAALAVGGLSFAALAVALALGQAFLLRRPPFPDAGGLLWIQSRHGGSSLGVSQEDARDLRAGVGAFAGLALFDARRPLVLALDGEAESVAATRADSALFTLLRVAPEIGRVYGEEADVPGAGTVALLGHDLWRRRFAGDPAIVGRPVTLDGAPFTVVGVMPEGFRFPVDSEIWVPRSPWSEGWGHRAVRVDAALARLRPGVPAERARQEAEAVAAGLALRFPDTNAGISVRLVPLAEAWTAGRREATLLLAGAALVLGLLAAANGVHLAAVRSQRLAHETAVRGALGATPARLLASRAAASAGVGLVAAAAGCALAAAALPAVRRLLPAEMPSWMRVGLDPAAVALLLAAGTVAGAAAGAGAWLAAGRPAAGLAALRAAPAVGASRGPTRRRRLLAVLQVAAALALTVSAGGMAASLRALYRVDPGFAPDDVLALRIDLPVFAVASYAEVSDLYRRLGERVGALPGVRAAALSTGLPLAGQETWHAWELTLERQDEAQQRANPRVHGQGVGDGYFAALDVPILEGRGFGPADAGEEAPGTIVSRSLALRLWPDGAAIGRRLKLGPPASPAPWLTVVGVAGDVRFDSLRREGQLDLYLPLGRLPSWPIHLLVEVDGPPRPFAEGVRRAVWDVSPQLGLREVAPLADRLQGSLWRERTWTALLSAFAALAVALALAGGFAAVAQRLQSRRRELALRAALGAARTDLARLALGEVATVAAPGLALGALASWPLGRLARDLLYATDAVDPTRLALAAAALLAALLAAAAPAIRAALTVEPRRALEP